MSVCVCVWAMLPDSNKMMMNDNNRSVFQQNKSLYRYNDKRAASALWGDNCIPVRVAQGRAQNDINYNLSHARKKVAHTRLPSVGFRG